MRVRIWVGFVIVVSFVLAGCNRDGGTANVSSTGVSVTAAVINLPTTGTLTAKVYDSGRSNLIYTKTAIPLSSTSVALKFTVSPGSHNFEVVYVYQDASFGSVEVANWISPQEDLQAGQNLQLSISASDFTYPDDDNDGVSNLDELIAGSNPNLMVTSTDPTNSVLNVNTVSSVSATFSAAMDSASIDNTTFSIVAPDGSAVDGVVSYDSNSKKVTFTPNHNLAIGTKFTAVLSKDMQDATQHPLGTDYTWVFTTRVGAWDSPELIETNNAGDADAPQVAMDGNGNAIAVWYQNDGYLNNIWANRYSAASGTWGTAQLIETDNAGSTYDPQVAIDGSGNAIALWSQSDGTRFHILVNRYSASSGTWGTTTQTIDTNNTGGAYKPQVAMDASGDAIAVWEQFDGTLFYIWANRYSAVSNTWGTAQLIETNNTGSTYDPQVAMDDSGNAIAVWSQNVGIFANHFSTANGTWGTAQLIEIDNALSADTPQVVMDGNGNAIAVWSQNDGTLDIVANRFSAASGLWGAAQIIDNVNAGDADSVQISMNGSGDATTVWEQDDGTGYKIWANRYSGASGTWGTTAQLIETDNALDAENPQVAMDGNGNVIAVWQQFDGTQWNILANRYSAVSSTWETAQMIETDNAGSANSPQVAIDGNGDAIAVWYQYDGNDKLYNIVSNRFEEPPLRAALLGTGGNTENGTAEFRIHVDRSSSADNTTINYRLNYSSGLTITNGANIYLTGSGTSSDEVIFSLATGTVTNPLTGTLHESDLFLASSIPFEEAVTAMVDQETYATIQTTDNNASALSGPISDAVEPTLSSIQDNIFTPVCASCHDSLGTGDGITGLDLSSATASYNNLVNIAVSSYNSSDCSGCKRVDPNNPDTSYLVKKIEGETGTKKMPLTGSLSVSDIAVIREWISNGANNN